MVHNEQRPLPTDDVLRIIATSNTELKILLQNYTKTWVHLYLEEMEMCDHLVHTISHEGFEPNNNCFRILTELYEVEVDFPHPQFELLIEGMYLTITSGTNNPLPHKCPNQIDRLVDYINYTYRQLTDEPIIDYTINNYDDILIQFICSVLWNDGRGMIIEWCRNELVRRINNDDE